MTTNDANETTWHLAQRPSEVKNAAIIMWVQVGISTLGLLILVGIVNGVAVDLSALAVPLLIGAAGIAVLAVAAANLPQARKWAWVLALVGEGLVILDRLIGLVDGTVNLFYIVGIVLPVIVIVQLVKTRAWFTR
ncbi:hypothetical protein [Actinokineospora bangkokensis]|uniref:Uncharacterized protein n=1 Tax=Actinokineospora bangkokensis TaxID=1193682 RepID=A0A1Q9LLZ5_9PSEU|nr:hypothetical protein [Actinokineospora bangkokensis]OLR93029.1 hypothetical protein BJP25_18920 [Actinokineospora bangkokensis]